MASARESDLTGLHWFPKDFEAVAAKFWQFVQKQHTPMSQGNFSRTRLAAATD